MRELKVHRDLRPGTVPLQVVCAMWVAYLNQGYCYFVWKQQVRTICGLKKSGSVKICIPAKWMELLQINCRHIFTRTRAPPSSFSCRIISAVGQQQYAFDIKTGLRLPKSSLNVIICCRPTISNHIGRTKEPSVDALWLKPRKREACHKQPIACSFHCFRSNMQRWGVLV